MRAVSLRRRVVYSLAIVRLVLVPVILLAVYYLFAEGGIIDRIVNVDTPVATLAERTSVEMLAARRAEQNYFLFHDKSDLEDNRQAIARLQQIIADCGRLQPSEADTVREMQKQVSFYQSRFEAAQARTGPDTVRGPITQLRQVVKAYQRDLDDLLRNSNKKTRSQMIEDLRSKVGSFDSEVNATLSSQDPLYRVTSQDLQTSSDQVIKLAAGLEDRSWQRVNLDHEQARRLTKRAEWVLVIVSSITLLISIWVSFILPREVVQPLADLKNAVDHVAAGNYGIEFDVEGDGEVVQLAKSIRRLLEQIGEKEMAGRKH